ncbi:MAG: biotin--[acetyl-CoA-carboxylase] ligase [Sulfolobales archaeon]|nr:biotin--[acetyl-CoA-carboxylase] ligase [Sulfolobales archaeon]
MLAIRLTKVTSTQDFAEAIHDMIEEKEFVVVAEEQTKARGRFGRAWYSPKGGLWVTYVMKDFEAERVPDLTLANALAIRKALERYVKAKIRWPNDVVVNDKKIAGVLVEAIARGDKATAFVGFGVDTNVTEFPKDVRATSVLLETGKLVDNDELMFEIISLTKEYLRLNLSQLAKELDNYSSLNGREVRISGEGWEKRCKALFVDFMGRLVTDCGIFEVEEVHRVEVI